MSQTTAAPVRERRRTPGWVPILLGVLAFALVLASLGVAAVDWFTRNAEMNRLVSAIEASEAQMEWTQDHIGFVFEENEGKGRLTEAQRSEVDAALKEIVAEGRERIAAAGTDVAQVPVLPWHADVLRAQSAYVRHNEAWQEYMWLAEQDTSELTADQPEVNDTFVAAEEPLKQAVPDPALYDLRQRVTDIFVEGMPDESSPSGPTQEVGLRG